MGFATVIVDLKGHSAPAEKPLMLHELLFCPVLTWLCQELSVCGAKRFFIICPEAWQESAAAALAAFPGAQLFADAAEALAAAEGEVLVIPSPVLPVNAFSGSPTYSADVETLRCAIAVGKSLAEKPGNAQSPLDLLPFRSAVELQRAMPLCRDAIITRLAEQGVTVIDPTNTYIDPRCSVGEGTVILPGTILRGSTVIGKNCEIGPNAMIRDCTVGDDTTVNASQLNESRVGDFVEVKNSVIGNGTKISHLTYVGDSDVGEKVNFGCGTVTTNYDGHNKFRCTIGDNVFLGCNTNLVAPVTLGDGAYTAAGSTVTEDVPADALAIARQKQTNKEGWAAKFRAGWIKK